MILICTHWLIVRLFDAYAAELQITSLNDLIEFANDPDNPDAAVKHSLKGLADPTGKLQQIRLQFCDSS